MDQWRLKTRRSAQGSAFLGSERYVPKFRGSNRRTPQKTEIMGAWIGLLSLNHIKIQILIENITDRDKIFTGCTYHEWTFVGGPIWLSQRIQDSADERLEHKCIDLSDYNTYLNQIW